MRVQLRCKQCSHGWTVQDEPQALARLACPACNAALSGQLSEDFASALEDALTQLWGISQHFEVDVSLGTAAIPAAFLPER